MGFYDRNNFIRILILHRDEARAAKDWVRSDQLRATLVKQGVRVNDTPGCSEYFYIRSSPHDPNCPCRRALPPPQSSCYK